jgi:uncharacterized protein YjiS (DUF1127 family)
MTSLIMTADTIGLHKVSSWFKKLETKRAQKAKEKNTIKELSRLSDRELRDIGINRGMIYSIAKESTHD